MFLESGKRFALLSFFCLIIFCSQVAFAGDEWREVSPAEMAMKTSKVEPNADAEAIFWEVRVDDSSADLVMKHYLRVKVFTEAGREKYSKVDIPFTKGMRIKDIEARVIKPDGSIVELAKEDIFEREIVKTNDVKVKAKSFAVPNIEPGVIIEYRYKEVLKSGWAQNMRMVFQHDIPIQDISYYFKPSGNLKYFTFNMSDTKFVKDKGGFYRASMTNVPALKEEPRMPPEDEVRSWILIYYTDERGDSDEFWSHAGYYIAKAFDIKKILKPGKNMVAAAEQIATGASSQEDKIAKIFDFCKTKVKNISYDASLTDEERDEIKENKSSEDTYKKMQGTSNEINELFASMADALGFETRLAFGGDRSEKFFNPRQAHISFIHFSAIAVKVNNQWQYFDPGSRFTPYGMLPWFEEDTSVLLLGYKDYMTTETPISSPDKSLAKRTAKFKLLEDGTLEGTVKVEYTGHLSFVRKMNNYDEAPAKREENLKEEITKKISTADVSGISIENVDDPQKPFIYQYKVRVPNYAQKTGKRLFLQPGFFEYGSNPLFSSASRKYDIYFNYPWSEEDDVEIQLPEGFSLDNADAPDVLTDAQKISFLKVEMRIDNAKNTLTYNRKFYFGGGGNTLFPVNAYDPIKNLFDQFHKADTHTITLKQN
ncbi:MAG: DUF3857 and transglutaminase domain-containing protein [Pyrinomonadaceae bacterium]